MHKKKKDERRQEKRYTILHYFSAISEHSQHRDRHILQEIKSLRLFLAIVFLLLLGHYTTQPYMWAATMLMAFALMLYDFWSAHRFWCEEEKKMTEFFEKLGEEEKSPTKKGD